MSAPSGSNGFEPVASIGDLPEGELLGVTRANGERLCLFNHGGQIGAVPDECTHQAFPLSSGTLEPDGTIQCVWHGARFDCRTGAVRKPPATEPLPLYEVRVEGDRILVGPRVR